MPRINPLPILISFILLQLIGFVWYHEDLFGTAWLRDVGLDPYHAPALGVSIWVVMVLGTLLKVYLLALILNALGVRSWTSGLLWGIILGFGLLAMTLASHHGFAMRPARQTLIEGGQEILGYALAGAILAGWPKRDTGTAYDSIC